MNDKPFYAEMFPMQKDRFLEALLSLWALDKPFLKAAEFSMLEPKCVDFRVLFQGSRGDLPET